MITDEDLAIYVDGALEPDRVRAVEAALAVDPELRARLDRFRRTDDDVRAALGLMLERPPYEALEAAVRARIESHFASDNVTALANRRAATPRWAWPASIAAALVAGVLVGRMVLPVAGQADWIVQPGSRAPRAGQAMAAGLSSTPSGVAFDLPGGRSVKPVLTFASASGALCRQFEILAASDHQDALACRSKGDAWRLVAMAPGGGGPSGSYRTAAGPGADPVSAMVDSLIAGDPFDARRETAALHGR